MMNPINELPKGAVLLFEFVPTHGDILSFLLEPLAIAKIQHGVGLDNDDPAAKMQLFVLKKDKNRALKIVKRVTGTVDYLKLSKLHRALYESN